MQGRVGECGTAPEGSGIELVNHGMDLADTGLLLQLSKVRNSREHEGWRDTARDLELTASFILEVVAPRWARLSRHQEIRLIYCSLPIDSNLRQFFT
jgi:hypothetical protein